MLAVIGLFVGDSNSSSSLRLTKAIIINVRVLKKDAAGSNPFTAEKAAYDNRDLFYGINSRNARFHISSSYAMSAGNGREREKGMTASIALINGERDAASTYVWLSCAA